ncbi:hypothetical protein BCR34DRAFT_592265 [Clohesyomyces aquaticus]|uniref:Six-hairpin glycosidase-like protein n=1 Tax=Clohesyomyces aquaticus TaxID=1231657 RepID=A0A1Y1YTS5_9PLEO|nr:hypothetical protein BCR34DRAFT_592265 [Clohesyomyces aquaticus]
MLLLYSLVVSSLFAYVSAQNDGLGLSQGYSSFSTDNFNLKIVKSSQTLASLTPRGQTFDFLPFDYLSYRARNGQYHLGDITYRYRIGSASSWTSGDSAIHRAPVQTLPSNGSLASASMSATISNDQNLDITRSWRVAEEDLVLQFALTNKAKVAVEVGSLGFPLEFNSIFTGRTAEEVQAKCSLHDPYIGLDAGYVSVTPVSGTGPSLIVTPLNDTRFEGWRNLKETSYQETGYGSQTFEGFYEWQVSTLAYAENEWKNVTPWNAATSIMLRPGEQKVVGLRFSIAKDGVRGIDDTLKRVGIPVATGIPGYIVPQDLTAELHVFSNSKVISINSSPGNAFTVSSRSANTYTLLPTKSVWGRVRLAIFYADNLQQSVHYYITKPGPTVLSDLGTFSTTAQWYTNTSDPFHRAPSVMSYDRETNSPVLQDPRVWIAGLSDEGGAGAYLAAVMKQFAHPSAAEIAKLELFINTTLFGVIQNLDYSVKKSIFFHDPAAVPGYRYSPDINWSTWASWNKSQASNTGRAYDYVHVIATYWAMYRIGRAYPSLLTLHPWTWYLTQASKTVFSLMRTDASGTPVVDYALVGLMEETVIGELLTDLYRENYTLIADRVSANMSYRANLWNKQAVPFGSEMAWDSTGQEGVYYWSTYFNLTSTTTKAINTVLGYTPTVPHWGYNGNARRYWDNLYGGKLQRIERQIHHYGSGLNALVLLAHFRKNPRDMYALRAGYGGLMGPLSNVDQQGFGAASFHAWPDTLRWDVYSGDYGPGFLGLVLGSACYVARDEELGVVVFGGEMEGRSESGVVRAGDAVRRKVYVGPLGLLIEIDAGIIESVEYNEQKGTVALHLGQLDGVPSTDAATLWLKVEVGVLAFDVVTEGIARFRGGWKVPFHPDNGITQLSAVRR